MFYYKYRWHKNSLYIYSLKNYLGHLYKLEKLINNLKKRNIT